MLKYSFGAYFLYSFFCSLASHTEKGEQSRFIRKTQQVLSLLKGFFFFFCTYDDFKAG